MAESANILVVDDDQGILSVVSTALERAGYHVIAASDAAQALALLNGSVDLVLTDIVMPGVSGIEFANEVRKRLPDLPIILMSAWNSAAENAQPSPWPLVQKPFRIAALLDAVRDAISGQVRSVSQPRSAPSPM